MIPGWGKIFNIPSVFSSFYICPTKHKMRKSPRQKGRPIFPQELFPLLWVSNPAWLTEQQRWAGWLPLLQDVLCYQVSQPSIIRTEWELFWRFTHVIYPWIHVHVTFENTATILSTIVEYDIQRGNPPCWRGKVLFKWKIWEPRKYL